MLIEPSANLFAFRGIHHRVFAILIVHLASISCPSPAYRETISQPSQAHPWPISCQSPVSLRPISGPSCVHPAPILPPAAEIYLRPISSPSLTHLHSLPCGQIPENIELQFGAARGEQFSAALLLINRTIGAYHQVKLRRLQYWIGNNVVADMK